MEQSVTLLSHKTADLSVENSHNGKTLTLTLRLMLRNWQVLS